MPKLKNKRWELFARAYVSRETFCNGSQSYSKAYSIKIKSQSDSATCRTNSCKLLTNTNIQERINELIDKSGFNDESVDLEHLKVIKQDLDFKTKISAIKEYNNLKKRTSNSPTVTITQTTYEQHIINNPMGRVIQGSEDELRQIPPEIPKNQHQGIRTDTIPAKLSSGDTGSEDRETDQGEEAYPGFGA